MKNSIYTLLIAFTFIAGTTLLTSCSSGTTNESESSEQHEGHDHDKMASADYSCPMHLEITGKEGDKCSKCGMFLTKTVEGADEMKEHSHHSDTLAYSCPMHSDEKGIKGDKCSKCKMSLTASADEMNKKSCKHKDGKACTNCKKKDMKCDHKKGENCPHCKKA